MFANSLQNGSQLNGARLFLLMRLLKLLRKAPLKPMCVPIFWLNHICYLLIGPRVLRDTRVFCVTLVFLPLRGMLRIWLVVAGTPSLLGLAASGTFSSTGVALPKLCGNGCVLFVSCRPRTRTNLCVVPGWQHGRVCGCHRHALSRPVMPAITTGHCCFSCLAVRLSICQNPSIKR